MATTQEIEEWVQKNGYPLEMRVTREIWQHGPDFVQQSSYARDRTTGKMREIDVDASWFRVQADGTHVRTDLVVECKSGPRNSWVLFQGQKGEGPTSVDPPRTVMVLGMIPSYFPRPRLSEFGTELYFGESIPAFLSGVFKPCRSVVQRSESQSKAQNSDPAFNAVRKIAGAARVLADPAPEIQAFIRCIPLIVVSFDLFFCSLKSDSTIAIETTHRASIIDIDDATGQRTEVHIVTESALPQFVAEIEEMSEVFGAHPDFSDHGA